MNSLRSCSRCGHENRTPFADAKVPLRPSEEWHQCPHPGSEKTAPLGAGANCDRAYGR